MGLSRAQQNDVFRAIQQAGMDPGACKLFGADSETFGFGLRHYTTGSSFALVHAGTVEWLGVKQVGSEDDPQADWTVRAGDWNGV